jgi:hypothetical protein
MILLHLVDKFNDTIWYNTVQYGTVQYSEWAWLHVDWLDRSILGYSFHIC